MFSGPVTSYHVVPFISRTKSGFGQTVRFGCLVKPSTISKVLGRQLLTLLQCVKVSSMVVSCNVIALSCSKATKAPITICVLYLLTSYICMCLFIYVSFSEIISANVKIRTLFKFPIVVTWTRIGQSLFLIRRVLWFGKLQTVL